METRETLKKWLSVYRPELYLTEYKTREQIEEMLASGNAEQIEEAETALWRFWCFYGHFCDYESGKVAEREETKIGDTWLVSEHENDLGINNLQNTKKIKSNKE